MNSFRLKPLVFIFVLAIAFSCNKDEEVPAYVTNNSVKPVDFLTDGTYSTLNLELAYVEGYAPSQNAVDNLTIFLSQRLNKKGGIKITKHTIPATGRTTIDIDAVRTMEQAQRTLVTKGGELTAWIMFLDTEFSQNTSTEKVLGITYGASSIAIFEKTVYSFFKPDMPSRGSLETVILNHEFGHVLGLVNSSTPMVTPHRDDAHGAHCSNEDCLMYWKAESTLKVNDVLGNDIIPVLDANCVADLKAAGGK